MKQIHLSQTGATQTSFKYIPMDFFDQKDIPSLKERVTRLEEKDTFIIPKNHYFSIRVQTGWRHGVVLEDTCVNGPLDIVHTKMDTSSLSEQPKRGDKIITKFATILTLLMISFTIIPSIISVTFFAQEALSATYETELFYKILKIAFLSCIMSTLFTLFFTSKEVEYIKRNISKPEKIYASFGRIFCENQQNLKPIQ